MNHKRPPIPAIILVLLIIAFGGYFIATQALNKNNGALTASGTIEGTQVNVSPEIAGRVKEVFIEEGQPIEAGAPLLSLDDSLLTAQRAVAVAALESAKSAVQTTQAALAMAQAQYQVALNSAQSADILTRTQDWRSRDKDLFNQPMWFFTRSEQIRAAQAQVNATKVALDDAQANLAKVQQDVGNADFLNVEKQLLDARVSYLVARDTDDHAENSTSNKDVVGVYNRIHYPNKDDDLANAGQTIFDNAKAQLNSAQRAYDNMLTSKAAGNILKARAQLAVALEHYYVAQDHLRSLQTGDQSPQVIAAQKAVDQASAAADQAQTAIAQAQANLDLIDAQVSKLTVYAPMDGVILTRNIEPGEFVQPGGVTFTMADLSNLTITVYVPEDRYGQIALRQQAEVTVDSFPSATFNAEVIEISDKAEFTPRNVQTVEGRSSTVYAVKLKLTNPEGKLKIGMPADVVFK